MDDMHARHQKERRDLQSRITQKKKAATKKTRKGVNAECEALERDLQEQQDRELAEREVAPAAAAADDVPELANDVASLEINEPEGDSAQLSRSKNLVEPGQESESVSAAATARKPNRQKARLARRAAALEAQVTEAAKEAAELPDRREKERADMASAMQQYGRAEKEIRPDGHCLYAAVADQLTVAGLAVWPSIDGVPSANGETNNDRPGYRRVRQAAADHVRCHPDHFAPFLEEPLDTYTQRIHDTAEWGGHLELMAIAQAYRVTINVLQGDGRLETIAPEDISSMDRPTLWLAYYRHHYGLGEHYNSLRPNSGPGDDQTAGIGGSQE